MPGIELSTFQDQAGSDLTQLTTVIGLSWPESFTAVQTNVQGEAGFGDVKRRGGTPRFTTSG